ncbi:MAG: GlsB/YeaQ/YmgE family stress response membrane protein [Ktedonobacteraceae bacterium]
MTTLLTLTDLTIRIGDHIWNFGTNVIVYLIVAAIVGVIAEFLVGWRLPFGIAGAIIAGLIGVWLMTSVIIISGFSDYTVDGVPLIRALVGAIILVALWHALTYRSWYHRRRRYYR